MLACSCSRTASSLPSCSLGYTSMVSSPSVYCSVRSANRSKTCPSGCRRALGRHAPGLRLRGGGEQDRHGGRKRHARRRHLASFRLGRGPDRPAPEGSPSSSRRPSGAWVDPARPSPPSLGAPGTTSDLRHHRRRRINGAPASAVGPGPVPGRVDPGPVHRADPRKRCSSGSRWSYLRYRRSALVYAALRHKLMPRPCRAVGIGSRRMKHDLNAILDLVRSGRLQDATDGHPGSPPGAVRRRGRCRPGLDEGRDAAAAEAPGRSGEGEGAPGASKRPRAGRDPPVGGSGGPGRFPTGCSRPTGSWPTRPSSSCCTAARRRPRTSRPAPG